MTHHVDARVVLSPSKLDAKAASELRAMCKQRSNARGIGRMRRSQLIALIAQIDETAHALCTDDDYSIVCEESRNAIVGVVLQDLISHVIAMHPEPSRLTNKEQPLVGNDGAFYEVEEILGSRWVDGREMFHVRWKGFGSADDTWEPIENFQQ
jgi:hypothetical protein